MPLDTVIPFLIVILAAGYFQTVTGFGLSMIVIGASASLGLTSIATLAAVVNILALFNSGIALPGRLHGIDRGIATPIILAVVPAIALGLALLTYLSSEATGLLRIALGALVIYGGISVVWRARPLAAPSSTMTLFLTGAGSGICGGLFGMSGPPLIYQLYRQPIALAAIRDLLLLVFAITSGVRIVLLLLAGRIDTEILLLAAIAVPAVAIGTVVGRRYPPPLSAAVMRRVIFVVLVGIGSKLIVGELLALSG